MNTKKKINTFSLWKAILCSYFYFSLSRLTAQDMLTAEANVADESSTIWTMFLQGGWAMYPLFIFSIALVSLALYCVWLIRESRFLQPEAIDDLREAISNNDLKSGQAACDAYPGYTTDIVRAAFEAIDEGHNSLSTINEALEERASKVLASPLVFVQYLQVIASVSPMVGLLGTVSGMVKAFRNIAAQGLGKPELLANNISEALVTTATGLLIAIPALMAYFYFKNKYTAASAGIYEHIGSFTRQMLKKGMITGGSN